MRLLVAALFCLAPAAARTAEGEFKFFEPLQPPRAFQVMVHRGMAEQAPENMRRAIELCIEDGFEWVDVDLRLTKDGRHVLFGDDKLEGKTNGRGGVKDHTLEELKQLDAGSWFAKRFAGQKLLSLDECLMLIQGRINLCVNCQDVDPEHLVKNIASSGLESQVIVFGQRDKLVRVRAASDGKIAVMCTWHPQDGFGTWLDELHPAAVDIDANEVTPEICRTFHERGIKVRAKMLGERDDTKFWDKVRSDGVDYLQSGRPEEIVAQAVAKKLQPRPVRLTCHRGASRYAPENTLKAFDKAARLKADFVEFDVRPSSDGTFFLLHDASLNRTTTGTGPIRQSTAAAVEGLDAGSWFGVPFRGTHVPTLEAFLSAVSSDVSLYFDAKDIPPAALAEAINKHGLAERTVVYQGADYLMKLRAIDSRIRALPPAASESQVTELAQGLKPYGVDTPWRVLSKKYIDHCHAAGIQVFSDAPPYVTLQGYRQAIGWGIDVIQTDYPIRLWRAMEEVVEK